MCHGTKVQRYTNAIWHISFVSKILVLSVKAFEIANVNPFIFLANFV